jgi:hypothetical protein
MAIKIAWSGGLLNIIEIGGGGGKNIFHTPPHDVF